VLGAQWLESQEQEVPDDVLVVVVVIVEAGDDVVDAELVLGVLEQRDEGNDRLAQLRPVNAHVTDAQRRQRACRFVWPTETESSEAHTLLTLAMK